MKGLIRGLNQSKGNMYPWVTHTWNPIKGKCLHDCVYCYMKVWPQKPLRLDDACLNQDLGKGNIIFVGSSTDMWAKSVPDSWIDEVLEKCRLHPENTYLFQSKNPSHFENWQCDLPNKTILATTLETNRDHPETTGKAPTIGQRFAVMAGIDFALLTVTIEPIMDFDLDEFVNMIISIHPEFVSIGADSKNHGLPEPTPDKVEALISELQIITKIKVKDNLARLRK